MPLLFPWLPNRHPDAQTEGVTMGEGRERWKGGGGTEKEKKKKRRKNLNEQKQFCHREQIQLKSLLDGQELELSDQATALNRSEQAKLASGVGFPWPVIGSHIVLARHLAIFKYNGRNECK